MWFSNAGGVLALTAVLLKAQLSRSQDVPLAVREEALALSPLQQQRAVGPASG